MTKKYKLDPFQEEDLQFFIDNPKSALWYEPRLGKTVVSSRVLTETKPKTTLIVCPSNALFVWKDHLEEIFQEESPDTPIYVHIVRGDASDRRDIWINVVHDWKVEGCHFYIVVWNSFIRDAEYMTDNQAYFSAVIADEYHKFLKKRSNVGFEKIKPFVVGANRFHPLSGTPAGKGQPQQFWPVLHLMDNNPLFRSYWKFVDAHAFQGTDMMGHKKILGVKDGPSFLAMLNQNGRVRLRKDCAPFMPEIRRSLLRTEMTDRQRQMYAALDLDSYFWAKDDEAQQKLVVGATSMEKMLRMRQLLVCPEMLDRGAGVGGAFESLTTTLLETDDDMGKHTVIFTPFVPALEVFKEYLNKEGFSNVWILQGGLEPSELKYRIEAFKASRGIILCSTKYAQAFNLAGPQACYHVGYEWDPDDNKQAEDRIIPRQGENPLMSWYYTYYSTVDQRLCEAVSIKQQGINMMLGAK